MEAIASVSMGRVAVCPVQCEVAQSAASSLKQKNAGIPMRKDFMTGTALRTSCLSGDFYDQGHLQFYVNVQCSRKEKMNKRSPKAYGKERDTFQDCMGIEDRKQMMKAKKKMSKAKGEKKMAYSSSSSSSSSESSDCEPKRMLTERKETTSRRNFEEESPSKARKFDVEEFRKEWEELSQSELMNSIPRFTSEFTIEPPLNVTIEHLHKSYNLPTFRPPPQMVEDSVTVAELPTTVVPADSVISHSLLTIAGLAVVEDISEDFMAAQVKPATAHVEVCMGGKCKKAGAGEILAAFQSGIPGVIATSCKCMKNCKSAVSIRIEDGSQLQTYTGVNLQDVDVLLQKHCSTGSSPAGLSSFNSQLFDNEPQPES